MTDSDNTPVDPPASEPDAVDERLDAQADATLGTDAEDEASDDEDVPETTQTNQTNVSTSVGDAAPSPGGAPNPAAVSDAQRATELQAVPLADDSSVAESE